MLILTNKEKTGKELLELNEIENSVNATQFNSIEMEEPAKKSDFDLSYLEYGIVTLTANVNNEITTAIFDEAAHDAKEADEGERGIPLMTALKTYPKAASWSLFVSTTVLQEAYDTPILASFYALPAFQKKFGFVNVKTGEYKISAS